MPRQAAAAAARLLSLQSCRRAMRMRRRQGCPRRRLSSDCPVHATAPLALLPWSLPRQRSAGCYCPCTLCTAKVILPTNEPWRDAQLPLQTSALAPSHCAEEGCRVNQWLTGTALIQSCAAVCTIGAALRDGSAAAQALAAIAARGGLLCCAPLRLPGGMAYEADRCWRPHLHPQRHHERQQPGTGCEAVDSCLPACANAKSGGCAAAGAAAVVEQTAGADRQCCTATLRNSVVVDQGCCGAHTPARHARPDWDLGGCLGVGIAGKPDRASSRGCIYRQP